MQVLEAFRIIRQVDDACIDVFVGARNFSRNLQVNQVPTHEVVLARAVHSYYFVHLCALQKLLFCTVSAIDRTKRGFKIRREPHFLQITSWRSLKFCGPRLAVVVSLRALCRWGPSVHKKCVSQRVVFDLVGNHFF